MVVVGVAVLVEPGGAVSGAVSVARGLMAFDEAEMAGDALPAVGAARVMEESEAVGKGPAAADVLLRPRADERKDDSAPGAAVTDSAPGARVP